MPAFNPADYETVAERIKRFYKDWPEGRIVTKNLTKHWDRAISTWVVYAEIYLNRDDQLNKLPKATGLAFEVDGVGMANKTSALENAETSAIGRALSQAGYFGDKKASREEMQKTLKAPTPKNWQAALENINDLDGLRALYLEAKQAKQSTELLDRIKAKADELSGNKG